MACNALVHYSSLLGPYYSQVLLWKEFLSVPSKNLYFRAWPYEVSPPWRSDLNFSFGRLVYVIPTRRQTFPQEVIIPFYGTICASFILERQLFHSFHTVGLWPLLSDKGCLLWYPFFIPAQRCNRFFSIGALLYRFWRRQACFAATEQRLVRKLSLCSCFARRDTTLFLLTARFHPNSFWLLLVGTSSSFYLRTFQQVDCHLTCFRGLPPFRSMVCFSKYNIQCTTEKLLRESICKKEVI